MCLRNYILPPTRRILQTRSSGMNNRIAAKQILCSPVFPLRQNSGGVVEELNRISILFVLETASYINDIATTVSKLSRRALAKSRRRGESRGKVGLPFLRLENDHGDFTPPPLIRSIYPVYSRSHASPERAFTRECRLISHLSRRTYLVTKIAKFFFAAESRRKIVRALYDMFLFSILAKRKLHFFVSSIFEHALHVSILKKKKLFSVVL